MVILKTVVTLWYVYHLSMQIKALSISATLGRKSEKVSAGCKVRGQSSRGDKCLFRWNCALFQQYCVPTLRSIVDNWPECRKILVMLIESFLGELEEQVLHVSLHKKKVLPTRPHNLEYSISVLKRNIEGKSKKRVFFTQISPWKGICEEKWWLRLSTRRPCWTSHQWTHPSDGGR